MFESSSAPGHNGPGSQIQAKIAPRAPRYQRRPEGRSFCLTDRDIKIIRLVYEHRFLSSRHILALFPGNRKRLLERLYLLFHHHLLERLRLHAPGRTNQPIIYALTNQGADHIAHYYSYPLATVDWNSRNARVKTSYLRHTLMISDFLTVFRLACREFRDRHMVNQEDFIGKRWSRLEGSGRHPLGWSITCKHKHARQTDDTYERVVIPDAVFGLRLPGRHGREITILYCLEADRGTMPITRNDTRASSYQGKMLTYCISRRQRVFGSEFGTDTVRFLTLTTSWERAQSMVRANQRLHPQHRGFKSFLFARAREFTLENPARVFDDVWINGLGEKANLLD